MSEPLSLCLPCDESTSLQLAAEVAMTRLNKLEWLLIGELTHASHLFAATRARCNLRSGLGANLQTERRGDKLPQSCRPSWNWKPRDGRT